MRLIDADELIHLYFDDENEKPVFDFVPWEFVENAPTIDAEPVVRCKDCKFADKFHQCDQVKFWASGDDFCSRGERKDEVENE